VLIQNINQLFFFSIHFSGDEGAQDNHVLEDLDSLDLLPEDITIDFNSLLTNSNQVF